MLSGHIKDECVLHSSRLSVLFCSVTVLLKQSEKKGFVCLSLSFFGSFILLYVFTPLEGSARGAN